MSPLESQKRLLLAESGINRVHLVGDLAGVVEDTCTLAARAACIGSIATCAAVLVTGLAARSRGRAVARDTRPSWSRTLLECAGLASTLWLTYRAEGRR